MCQRLAAILDHGFDLSTGYSPDYQTKKKAVIQKKLERINRHRTPKFLQFRQDYCHFAIKSTATF